MNNELINIASKLNLRVIIAKTFGLISYIRLYENYHANMNLRLLDNPINDLRIVNPWPELKEYCQKFNFEEMENIKHSHIPYIVILIQALDKYKEMVIVFNSSITEAILIQIRVLIKKHIRIYSSKWREQLMMKRKKTLNKRRIFIIMLRKIDSM